MPVTSIESPSLNKIQAMFGLEKKLRDQAFKWHGINEDIDVQNGLQSIIPGSCSPFIILHMLLSRVTRIGPNRANFEFSKR